MKEKQAASAKTLKLSDGGEQKLLKFPFLQGFDPPLPPSLPPFRFFLRNSSLCFRPHSQPKFAQTCTQLQREIIHTV